MNNLTSKIINSDCLEAMRAMKDNSIDSIVTDPPYGLSFMGKKWDYDVPSIEIWQECLRILKPGGHLLAFAGTRTQHRMAVRIEDAGFEIRDMIAWVYGSGFPKSLNIGKAIDKIQGNERIVIDKKPIGYSGLKRNANLTDDNWKGIKEEDTGLEVTKGNTKYEGWGTALKPAFEPITVARKPIQGKVADNVLKHGTGGINIDACRIVIDKNDINLRENATHSKSTFFKSSYHEITNKLNKEIGRFPANFIHDGSEEILQIFPQSKFNSSGAIRKKEKGIFGLGGDGGVNTQYNDQGTNARFFYCAKASKSERDYGLNELNTNQTTGGGGGIGEYLNDVNSTSGKYGSEKAPVKNYHPTVKPIELMRYLCRLVTPLKGVILDPFMGSGTTLLAAYDECFNCIGIEKDAEYVKIAEARLNAHIAQLKLELL
tara:strand:+ start:99 stop:1388 length:1290 start_codon:yes stop_codon:yes gene_type:complete